ncbi:helix-turn-helix domain-containing protein [Ewingella americana]|uniref:Transcriptional regulator n=1 Tax=Ewingella americana TaxID=41202 RepID=A0A502G9L6_9GAMM|nr:helix-turn-helix transcriptional regulator [Ewingella americana]TPG58857.1 transcriptional regulator [Ewingella americana]
MKKPAKTDWHQADIIAALRKKGTTLAATSRAAGLSSSTLANALSRPWPKGEMIIAQTIGVPPAQIWPSRYFDPQGEKITKVIRQKTSCLISSRR